MAKRQKDMCPFSYWRAREANSEGHMYGKKAKGHVLLATGEQMRQIQNAQVLSISSKSRDKKKVEVGGSCLKKEIHY